MLRRGFGSPPSPASPDSLMMARWFRFPSITSRDVRGAAAVSVARRWWVGRTVLVQVASLAIDAESYAKIDVGVSDLVVIRAIADNEEGGVTVGQVQEMVSVARAGWEGNASPWSDCLPPG